MMANPALMSLRCICKHKKASSAEKVAFTSLKSVFSFNVYVNTILP